MNAVFGLTRLVPLIAGAFIGATSFAAAQDKPVTPPDSYRVVMENDRVRMIEVHVKPHSKVNVDSEPGRERFLYMLSDGALILAPPGKMPYEFALHAGETAVFPAVSPTVENDTDQAVRALLVEVKQPMRSTIVAGKSKAKWRYVKGKARGRVAVAARSANKQTARGRRPQASASRAAPTPPAAAPLNLKKANAKPAKKVTGRSKGSSS
ncbi:MAG: cupin domain-containing protein [Alphaproteobacteria bacterium]|nr:MAG: cupin domain-containing protein [Alphaproteobacteria bacterium]